MTERPNIADHTFVERCWSLTYYLNDDLAFGERIEHPEVGPAIRINSRSVAPIPADKVTEVDALLAEFKAGSRRQHEAWVAAERIAAPSLRLGRDMDRPDSDN